MGTLTFWLAGELRKSETALLKGVGTLKEAGQRIEKRLGYKLAFWRSSDRRYVVKKQRNRRR